MADRPTADTETVLHQRIYTLTEDLAQARRWLGDVGRERDEARALLTAAVPVLEFDAVQGGNGDVLTRVRAWLGVCDG